MLSFVAVLRRVLRLERRAKKDAAVGRGRGFELDVQLVVGEVAGGHEEALLAGRDGDLAVFDVPVGFACGLPAEEGLAVEEGDPALGGLLLRDREFEVIGGGWVGNQGDERGKGERGKAPSWARLLWEVSAHRGVQTVTWEGGIVEVVM